MNLIEENADVTRSGILLVGNSGTSKLVAEMFRSSELQKEFTWQEDLMLISGDELCSCGLYLLDYDYFKSRLFEVSNFISTRQPVSQIYVVTQDEILPQHLVELKNFGSIHGAFSFPMRQEVFELSVIEILGKFQILEAISEEVQQKNVVRKEAAFHWQDSLLGVIIAVESIVKFSYIKESITQKSDTLLGMYLSGIASKLSEDIRNKAGLIRIDIGSIDLMIHLDGEVMFIFMVKSLDKNQVKIVKQLMEDIENDIRNSINPSFFIDNIIYEEDLLALEEIVKSHDLKRVQRSLHGPEVSCILYQPPEYVRTMLEDSIVVSDVISTKSLNQILNLSDLSFPQVICYNANILTLDQILNVIKLINSRNPIIKQILFLEEFSSDILLYLMNLRAIDYILLPEMSNSDVLNIFELAISKSVTNSIGAYSSMTASDIEDHLYHSLIKDDGRDEEKTSCPELISLRVYNSTELLLEREWNPSPTIDFGRMRSLLSSLQDMDQEVLHQSKNMVGFEVSDHYFIYKEVFGFEFLYTLKNVAQYNLESISYSISENSHLLSDLLIDSLTYGEKSIERNISTILEDTVVKIHSSLSYPSDHTDKMIL